LTQSTIKHKAPLTLLVGRQEGHPACKKTEWWGAGVVICLERGADLHIAQLMPLLLTVSCFSKIQIGFTFLVPAHPGSPGKRAVKRVCEQEHVRHNNNNYMYKLQLLKSSHKNITALNAFIKKQKFSKESYGIKLKNECSQLVGLLPKF